MNKIDKMKNIILFFSIVLVMSSCLKMNDNIQEYLDRGEINYLGKVDSVMALSGKERVLLLWRVSTDPRIEQCWVHWNNNRDSAVFPVSASAIDENGFMSAELKIPEGTYIFTMYHTGSRGFRSVREVVTGRSYGANYQRFLMNRRIIRTDFTVEGLTIDWSVADNSEVGVQLEYTDINGEKQTIIVESTETTTFISDFLISQPISYTTMYKPDITAIDTFYVQKVEKQIPFLLNLTNLFNEHSYPYTLGALIDGTFNRLHQAPGWKTNEAARLNGNIDNISALTKLGVGLCTWPGFTPYPTLLNAKLYQTVELEAGNYSFYVYLCEIYNNVEDDRPELEYSIVAALGEDLPDYENLEQEALEFLQIPMMEVNPNFGSEPKLEIDFVLTSKSKVSLGLVANSYEGQGVIIRRIELWNYDEK